MAEQPIIVKKKVVKGHAHHGGSWKVAYADFVTSMMAFFMVMWLMNMTQADKDQIQGYFNDPLGFASTNPKSRVVLTMEGMPKPKPTNTAGKGAGDNDIDTVKNEQETLKRVQKKIQKELSSNPSLASLAKNIRMSITSEGLLIEFMETQGAVFFETGSAIIRPEALKVIATVAPILTQSKHPIQVQGHTDNQPFAGAFNGNWALSTSRATSLLQALEDDKVPDKQIEGVQGYAATRPLDPIHPTSFSNRRVTILLPRKYTSDRMSAAPADVLHEAMTQGNEPEAVVVKPDQANLMAKYSP